MKKTRQSLALLILIVVMLFFCTSRVMADEQVSPETPNTEIIEKIPAELGKVFGIKYRITGCPSNEDVEFEKVVTHPPIKKTRWGKKTTGYSVVLKETSDAKGIVENFTGFQFEHEYELVPGLWQFKLFYKDKLIVEKTFNVYLEK